MPETLVAAFRATLEEISDSDLLLHVVDASNPQSLSQIESVDKILHDLEVNDVPRLIVLNKADLLEQNETEALGRQICLDKQSECVAVSAINSKSLEPLLNRIGEILAKDLSQRTEVDSQVSVAKSH